MTFVYLDTTSSESVMRMQIAGVKYPFKTSRTTQGTPIKKLKYGDKLRYLDLKASRVDPMKYAVDYMIHKMAQKWLLPENRDPRVESVPMAKFKSKPENLFPILSEILAANGTQDIKGKRKADPISPVTAYLTEQFESQRYARFLKDHYDEKLPDENDSIPTICLSGPPITRAYRQNAPVEALCDEKFQEIIIEHYESLHHMNSYFPSLYKAIPGWLRYAKLVERLRNESPAEVDAVLAQYQDVFPCCVVEPLDESESSNSPSPRPPSSPRRSRKRKAKAKTNTCKAVPKELIQNDKRQSLYELPIPFRRSILSNIFLVVSISYLLIRWYLRGIT